MATDYELTLNDYLSIVRHRAPYMIGAFFVALVVTAAVALLMPKTYRSTGTIMVESQHVPDSIVPTAAQNLLDERINVIMQRVMTRESLLKIANKYNLFKDSAGTLSTAELIDKMRMRINVEMVQSDTAQGGRMGKSTIAFNLSFDDGHPDVAYQIAKDLAALFLDWNVKLRTEGATETATFLIQESEKLKAEVDSLDAKISEFKRQNSNNLPEQVGMRTSTMDRTENDLQMIEREIRDASETLHTMEAEQHVEAGTGAGDDLPKLKATLATMTATYTDSHPDVRALKRKIDALEHEPAIPESKTGLTSAPNQASYKIEAVRAKLKSLTQLEKSLKTKISQNELALARTPLVAEELNALVRDRDTVQKKYEELLNKQTNAKIAQNLESENKSERFILLEPPLLPEKVFKPDRLKIFALGFFLSIAASGVVAMMLEMIDKRIRGVSALTHVLGRRPLIVIPYLTTREEEAHKKRLLKLSIIAAIAAMIVAIVLMHFLYMPLDALFIKIMAKF